MKKKLALFDFDGTITKKDTFIAFLKFSLGYRRLCAGLLRLFPVIILYLMRIYSNEKAKEIVIRFFYKDWQEERLKETGRAFAETVLPSLINPAALDRIIWHSSQGHIIYVVTASVNYWIEDWTSRHGLGLISTRLEIRNHRFTGFFLSRNCYGKEKENRIRTEIILPDFDYIYAYGDSRGDKEMLALADEGFYRKFG